MASSKQLYFELSRAAFAASFLGAVALFILERLKAGFVTNYVNFNLVVALALATGLAAAALSSRRRGRSRRGFFRGVLYLVLALAFAWVVASSFPAYETYADLASFFAFVALLTMLLTLIPDERS